MLDSVKHRASHEGKGLFGLCLKLRIVISEFLENLPADVFEIILHVSWLADHLTILIKLQQLLQHS